MVRIYFCTTSEFTVCSTFPTTILNDIYVIIYIIIYLYNYFNLRVVGQDLGELPYPELLDQQGPQARFPDSCYDLSALSPLSHH